VQVHDRVGVNIVEVLKRIGGESVWQAIGLRQLQEPAAQIDKAAELAQKWGTGAGQIWQAGPHRLDMCRLPRRGRRGPPVARRGAENTADRNQDRAADAYCVERWRYSPRR